MGIGVVAVAACFLLPLGLSASATPGVGAFPFPVSTSQLWLTDESGTVAGAEGPVRLLQATSPTSASANLPLIPMLEQLGLGEHEAVWYAPAPWNATREVVGDLTVDLYFFLNVQASTRLHVQLDDVAPDGTLTALGFQDHRVSIQSLLPHHIEFQLPATGAHLGKGHALRLLVAVDDIDVLTWLQYGSEGTPASVTVSHRLMDTDLDGIPDDADPCPTEPDCDHDGQVDGGQIVYNNTTVVQGPGGGNGGGNGGGGGGNGVGGASNSTGPVTYYEYYLIGQTPPTPPPGSAGSTPETAAGRANIELVGGGAMGLAGLLVAAGGLFGRHPL